MYVSVDITLHGALLGYKPDCIYIPHSACRLLSIESIPTAVVPVCPDIRNPAHGRIVFTNDTDGLAPYDLGTVALHICDQGYGVLDIFTGVQRSCVADGLERYGKWTNEDMDCSGEYNHICLT